MRLGVLRDVLNVVESLKVLVKHLILHTTQAFHLVSIGIL